MTNNKATFDVFATSFRDDMKISVNQYLEELGTSSTPEDLLITHAEFVLFISRVYGQLIDSVEEAHSVH